MSISIGGVDLFNQGLNNEYRIMVLERVIDVILKKNTSLIITQQEIESIRKHAIADLQKKYPQAGITEGSNKWVHLVGSPL